MRKVAFGFALVLWSTSLLAAIPVLLAPAAAGQSGAVKTTQVAIEGIAFKPPEIVVLKGSKVTWTNKDAVTTAVAHSVTSDDGQVETFDKDPVAPAGSPVGTTADVTFTKVGTIKYHCKYHASMHGTVHVVEQLEAATVNVTADDMNRFYPSLVRLNTSQSIVWKNTGATTTHDVTFEDPSIGSRGDLAPGGSVNHTFAQEGSYRYRCKYHSVDFETEMVGKVVVGSNATFPAAISITYPRPGDNVSGTVNVTGVVRQGIGTATVATGVEVSFDGRGNWSKAEGVENWTFRWDTRGLTNGAHEIKARAVAGVVPVANTSVNATVFNEASSGPTKKKGSPGFEVASILAAAGVAVLVGLRRRRDGA